MNSFGSVIEVDRANPARAFLTKREQPAQVQSGEIHARIDRFALTANNATYALFGEAMGYYGFYPAASNDRGIVPVWGYATITASSMPDMAIGRRLYGFWPFATDVVLEPVNANQFGFSDGAAHRQSLHSFYNAVTFADQDPFSQGDDTLVPALKPLFSTAWLIEDFLHENKAFGADTVLLTSASSKTALSTAYCAQVAGRLKARVVGLTSATNASFVRNTGLYDEVVVYDDVATLSVSASTIVDFAGDPALLSALHARLEAGLKYSCQVGKSHSSTPLASAPMPGPKPVLFFAPDQARDAAQRMGQAAFMEALSQRWMGLASQAKGWFEVVDVEGMARAIDTYTKVINGDFRGSQVFNVTPWLYQE